MRGTIQRAAVAAVAGMLIAGLAGGTVSAASSGRATMSGQVPAWAKAANFKSATAKSERLGFRVISAGRIRPGPRRWLRQSRTRAAPRTANTSRRPNSGSGSVGARDRSKPSRTGSVGRDSPSTTPHRTACTSRPKAQSRRQPRPSRCRSGITRSTDSTLRSPKTAISIPSSIAGTVEAITGLDESSALVRHRRPRRLRRQTSSSTASRARRTGTRPTRARRKRDVAARHLWPPDTLRTLWLHAPAGPRGLRCARLADGFRRDRGGHRRLCIADDRQRRPDMVDGPRHRPVQAWPVQPDRRARHVPATTEQEAGPQGWSGEETLDIEAVHGMAPMPRSCTSVPRTTTRTSTRR